MFRFNLSSTKTPSKSGIPGVPYVSIRVQEMLGVIDLTFFQKVDSFPRFIVELFFFPLSFIDCFSFLNNANFVSFDKDKSDSKFFLFRFEFVPCSTNRLAIYNSTSIRSLNIKKVSSAIRWVDNHNINWTLFADVCIDVITLFKKFVDRFVLTDRCFVLPRIHSCSYPCCR